jgi:exosortase/archaeosortase family protein
MAIPFYILLQLEPYFQDIQTFVAGNVYLLLLTMGFQPEQQGYFIFLQGKGLEVAPACVGWRSILAFTALVIATPRNKNKLKAILLVPVLYGFNLFRLITSLFAKIFVPNWFDIIHGFLWTYAMTFLVLGLWWYWVRLDR